jgi:hypothetical protein
VAAGVDRNRLALAGRLWRWRDLDVVLGWIAFTDINSVNARIQSIDTTAVTASVGVGLIVTAFAAVLRDCHEIRHLTPGSGSVDDLLAGGTDRPASASPRVPTATPR